MLSLPCRSQSFWPTCSNATHLPSRPLLHYDGLTLGELRQSQYHFVWPNTTINVAPGPLNLSIERWVPVGPRTTVEVTDYFFGPDVTEERIQEVVEWDTQVAQEDVALVEGVQAGLDSRAVPQGRLLPESEQLVAAFQRRVFEALAAQ